LTGIVRVWDFHSLEVSVGHPPRRQIVPIRLSIKETSMNSMSSRARQIFNWVIVVIIAMVIAPAFLSRAQAQATETVLNSFDGSDGDVPYAGLVFDASGNLYGTTGNGGGTSCDGLGCGVVFELTPQNGGWTETILHNFNDSSTDGNVPRGPLVFDAAGNLYGTTRGGGTDNCGTVFALSPNPDGDWTEKIIHSFSNSGPDGCAPYGGVILDAAGNLYGTTSGGGTYGWGTAFEFSKQAGGGWKEKLLHTFGGSTDGWAPLAGLVFDATGNLYGTTEFGGAQLVNDGGTVFQLLPQPNGSWRERLIANFTIEGSSPQEPAGSLVFDAAGNLYGTSVLGGHDDNGTAFELSPKGGGDSWKFTLLFSFGVTSGFGSQPDANVILDASGNIYGTTSIDGPENGSQGTVFELSLNAENKWTATVLYAFSIDSPNGQNPNCGLIFDSAGNLYGTTAYGGTYGAGTVFEVTP
jgi:uncharacterized repeat protein (TIGR03803 family)